MRFRHLSISKKLAIIFSICGIALVFLGLSSLFLFNRMNDTLQEITTKNIPITDTISQIRYDITDFRRYQLGYLLSENDDKLKNEYTESLQIDRERLNSRLESYKSLVVDQNELQVINRIAQGWQQYAHTHDNIMLLLANGETNQAKNILLNDSYEKFRDILLDVESLVKISRKFNAQNRDLAENSYFSAKVSIIVITILDILFLIVFSTLLTRQICHPLKMLVEQAMAIAKGNLGRGVLCEWIEQDRINHDETGQLAVAIRDMKDSLNALVTDITTSVGQLSTAAKDMSTISEQSADGMSQQLNEINQVATAMNQMQSTLQEVASNTTAAAEAANHALSASKEGTDIVQNTVLSIDGVAKQLTSASDVVQQLEQDSKNISIVLDVIRGIAEQTNLLALNAAIEAARAGEQGRGFAVVADEVRTLAQRTQKSTEEISHTIEMLQNRTAQADQAMQLSQEQMKSSLTLAEDAGKSILSINHAVNIITDMNNQIASATEEQNVVANELNRNITIIQSYADDNTQGTQKTASTCQDLNRLATDLIGSIRSFDLI
ncbi:methyl-accepting chemotaxis protein [Shewanella sp. NFH-SH190041]|uniref:methyl-accepting chemotaxis protein n=1 Tax=Shewanella sp. NFH-SH190041 TaxID=2950245 RepID=UPI0021C3AE3C|nr:methyl-accepting chemotaxis protein [Shewanella sp. NFH-SH190041]